MDMTARQLTGIAAILLIVIAAYFILIMPDRRTTTEKVGDAVHDIDKGPTQAARQLENRTPGEKLGDAVKDTGDNIKHSTSNP